MRRPGGLPFVAVVFALALAPIAQGKALTRSMPRQTQLLQSVNATRAAHGLRALRDNRLLDRAAALKADAIVACHAFSHTPCAAPFTQAFVRSGYYRSRTALGENLYYGTGSLGTPTAALEGWLASPPHRTNLLRAQWRDAGIAILHVGSLFGSSDVWLYVLDFGRRS